jgi:predicted permease
MVAIAPEGLPRLDTVAIDLRVAGFALASGLFTLLIFGVAPAIMLSRTRVSAVLAEGGRDGAPSRLLGQRAIVIAQIALALVLLTGASLFGETMFRLTSQPLGFNPTGVAVVSTTFTGSRYGDPARLKAARASGNFGLAMGQLQTDTFTSLSDQVLERVSALPGVTSAGAALYVPFVANPARVSAVMESRPDRERHDVLQQVVTAGYFEAMGMSIRSGRGFERADQPGPRVAVVSREFERRFFPNGAVHREFRQVYGENFELSVSFRIVGVVGDVKRQEFTDDDRPAYYGFNRQSGPVYHYVARTTGDPSAVFAAVRTAIAAVSPQLVVTSTLSLKERVDRSAVDEAFRATLSTVFGAAALILAAIGLYGLVTRRAADRRREFGVRVALGARPGDVCRLVVKDAVSVIALGLVVGLPAAYLAAQVTTSLLFGVTPSSPHVFAATAGTLATVALIATLLPARRASKGGSDIGVERMSCNHAPTPPLPDHQQPVVGRMKELNAILHDNGAVFDGDAQFPAAPLLDR